MYIYYAPTTPLLSTHPPTAPSRAPVLSPVQRAIRAKQEALGVTHPLKPGEASLVEQQQQQQDAAAVARITSQLYQVLQLGATYIPPGADQM